MLFILNKHADIAQLVVGNSLKHCQVWVRIPLSAPTIYALVAQLVAGNGLRNHSVSVRIRARVPNLCIVRLMEGPRLYTAEMKVRFFHDVPDSGCHNTA